jgi:hypothetical protein
LLVLAWLIEFLHEVTGYLLKYIRLIEEQIESRRRLHPYMKEQRKKKREEAKRNKGNTK